MATFNTSDSWIIYSQIEQNIRNKIEAKGIPLSNWDISIYRGILTGYNEAFIITKEKKEELISADPKSAEIIRPILRGRDIKKYNYDFQNLYLICTFPSKKYDINNYPAIKEHLLSFGKERLEQTGKTHKINNIKIKARKKTSNKWFETQDSISYWDDFSKQKIIYPNMTKYLPFVFDESGFMTNQKCFIITGEYLGYLTAFFNSSLFKFCFRDNFPELLGGTRELSKIFFDKIPVCKITEEQNNVFTELVREIQLLKTKGEDSLHLERKIDELLFDIYQLTTEERDAIGFIEII